MKTKVADGQVVGNKLIFSGDYSVLGVMLWCVKKFDPTAKGAFRIMDHTGQIVPPEFFQEMQVEMLALIEKYEKKVMGP